MKKIVALFLTLALMLSCVSALADGITLKVGFSEAETSQTAQVFKGIIERVAERTEGRVTLEPYYTNALGSINDSIEQISMGGNIIVSTSSEAWAAYGNYDLNALNMMYVFGSTDEVAAFNESALWKEMTDKLAAEGGIQLLCMNWAAAPRVVLANKAINSVEDLKGLLIRVPGSTYAKFFEALGASPVSGIPFAEVYQNIESGVIEAAEAPFATLSDYSVQEVAKYAFCTEHTYAAACWGTSTDIWNMISAEDQAVIVEEITAGGAEFTAMCAASNADYIKKMEEAGVTVVYPSDADKVAMSEAAAKCFEDPQLSEGLLAKIKENCK